MHRLDVLSKLDCTNLGIDSVGCECHRKRLLIEERELFGLKWLWPDCQLHKSALTQFTLSYQGLLDISSRTIGFDSKEPGGSWAQEL